MERFVWNASIARKKEIKKESYFGGVRRDDCLLKVAAKRRKQNNMVWVSDDELYELGKFHMSWCICGSFEDCNHHCFGSSIRLFATAFCCKSLLVDRNEETAIFPVGFEK